MNEEFKQLWSQSPPPNWFDMTEMQKYEYFFLAGQAAQKKRDAEKLRSLPWEMLETSACQQECYINRDDAVEAIEGDTP